MNTFYAHKDSLNVPLSKPIFETNKESNIKLVLKAYLDIKWKILCVVESKIQQEILEEALKVLNIEYTNTQGLEIDEKTPVSISYGKLNQGFEIRDKEIFEFV